MAVQCCGEATSRSALDEKLELVDRAERSSAARVCGLHSIARRHRVGPWHTTTSCCISLARILEQSTPGAASPAPLRRAPCRHTHPVSRSFPTSTYICSLRAACVLAPGDVARRNKRRLSIQLKLSREWTSRGDMQVEGEDQKPFGNGSARRSLSSLGLRAHHQSAVSTARGPRRARAAARVVVVQPADAAATGGRRRAL